MSIDYGLTEFQDLPRDDRLKIKHSIAEAAYDALIGGGCAMPRTALIGRLVQENSSYDESVIHYALQSGISRGRLICDSDDVIRPASSAVTHT